MQLAGKTALVTGGAVRLGRAISLALADAGMNVCLHYGHSDDDAEQTADDIRKLGRAVTLVQADLSDPLKAAGQIFTQCCEERGAIDVLINNAAIFESESLSDLEEECWDRHFAINLKAPAFLCREFVAQLPAQRPGSIINIADWRGLRPSPGHLSYTLTKSAIVSLTKLLAQELGPRGVRVNAIAPGAILPAEGGEEDFHQLVDQIPLRQTGSAVDIAEAVLYLLRSDFITGEVIHVTGGQQL